MLEDRCTRLDDLRDFKYMLIFPSGHYELYRRAYPCLFVKGSPGSARGEPVTGIFQSKNGGDDCLLYTHAQLNEDLDSNEYNPVGTALYPYMTDGGSIAVHGPVLLEALSGRCFTGHIIRHVLKMRAPAWHVHLVNRLLTFSPLIIMAIAFGATFALGQRSGRSVAPVSQSSELT